MKYIGIVMMGIFIPLFLCFSLVSGASYDTEVFQAQKKLEELGWNPGSVDGLYGRETKKAIMKFQNDSGLPVTGWIDEQTKIKLGISRVSRGIRVQRIVSPTGEELKGNQWLFVIGIDTYIEWPRLKTAVNDAKAIKDILLSRYHFDRSHVIELYDEQATRKNIIGKLRELATNVHEDDSLVIYYAGHGHLDTITKSGSWIPVESGVKDASAWISNHDIKNYLKVDAIKAKHVLLISDSCFSGDFFRGHRGKLPEVDDEVIKRVYKLTSRQAITSGGLEPVVDEGFGKHSVFSHFLIKTLKENAKPFLVPSDLFPEIKAGVVENAEQFPRFGSLKGTGGQQGGELVFFLKRDSRLKSLGAEASKRKKELEHLKKIQQAAKEAERKEAKEITKYKEQIAQLDTHIKDMKKRLGSAARGTDDSLETLLAMVRQKEDQERRLKELEQKRREEKQKRRAEIQRLKEEQEKKRRETFEADLSKYLKIIKSKYGKDIKALAWKSLISRWPEGKKLNIGDIERLKMAFRGVGRLHVTTKPENAMIRLINSKQNFYQDMELKKGQYYVEISKERYDTKKLSVSIALGKKSKLVVRLHLSAKERARLERLEQERIELENKKRRKRKKAEERREGFKAKFEEKYKVKIGKITGYYGRFAIGIRGKYKVVYDFKTGFEWLGISFVFEQSYNEAKRYAEKLSLDTGVEGWRLPSSAEIDTIIKRGGKYNLGEGHLLPIKYPCKSVWKRGTYGHNPYRILDGIKYSTGEPPYAYYTSICTGLGGKKSLTRGGNKFFLAVRSPN